MKHKTLKKIKIQNKFNLNSTNKSKMKSKKINMVKKKITQKQPNRQFVRLLLIHLLKIIIKLIIVKFDL